jgi:hypothetical protein
MIADPNCLDDFEDEKPNKRNPADQLLALNKTKQKMAVILINTSLRIFFSNLCIIRQSKMLTLRSEN